MTPRLLLTLALMFTAATGAGYWLGKRSSTPPTTVMNSAGSQRSHDRAVVVKADRNRKGGPLSAADLLAMGDRVAARARLNTMNDRDLSSLLRELIAMESQEALPMVARAWADLDAVAAMDFTLDQKDQGLRNLLLRAVFPKLAEQDPELARHRLAAVDDTALRSMLTFTLMGIAMEKAPDVWLAWMAQEPELPTPMNIPDSWAEDPEAGARRLASLSPGLQLQATGQLARLWAKGDPKAALAWAQSLTDETLRAKALAGIASQATVSDPDAALASLVALPDNARREGFGPLFSCLLDRDPVAAFDKALALTDPADKKAAISLMLENSSCFGMSLPLEKLGSLDFIVDPSDRRKVLQNLGGLLAYSRAIGSEAVLKQFDEKDRKTLISSMVGQRMGQDLYGAFKMMEGFPAEEQDPSLVSQLVSNVTNRSPDFAIDFLLSREDSEFREQDLQKTLITMTSTDPEGAIRRLNDLPPSLARDQTITEVTSTWAALDPAGALAWAGTLEGKDRINALGGAYQAMPPAEGARELAALLATHPEDRQDTLVRTSTILAGRFAEADPAATGIWVASLPDGSARNYATARLVETWYRADPKATFDWVASQPKGSQRDQAIKNYSSVLRRNKIPEPERRQFIEALKNR